MMSFSLALYPIAYRAKFDGTEWKEEFIERPHLSPAEESALSDGERDALNERRNEFPGVPLVNYTTQYGMGCFEGLKAFPQKSGGLAMFRPEGNAARFAQSMKGLRMPVYPEALFIRAVKEVVSRNAELGFAPAYSPEWEKDDFASAEAMYIRPFSYAEGGIGVAIPRLPSVFVIANPVGSYFKPGKSSAVVTDRIRATPNGTGWIKCDSNYVISALAKKEAEDAGFMEVLFLDDRERRYIEEGSSCNAFFYLKNGKLVTPELGDTILPGITRMSVIQIAREEGIAVEERKISIDEVMADAVEVFFTGTAAGVTFVESVTYRGRIASFGSIPGELTRRLGRTIKGIQYGVITDTRKWMYRI
jgi:branched-chain amino acid aminotransferase